MSMVQPKEEVQTQGLLQTESTEPKAEVVETTVSDEVPVTEVTSIAQEEERTGQKINVPSAEDLVARANVSFIQNLTILTQIIEQHRGGKYTVSRKGMNRLLTSILQLPMDDLKVGLQTKEEKLGFAIGQRCIADRFLLTQHHISQELKRRRELDAEAAAQAAAAPVEPVTEPVTATEEVVTNQGEVK